MNPRPLLVNAIIVCAVFVIVFAVSIFAASCDTGARKDLPQENQRLDESDADIIVMPDDYPNIAHKCSGTTGTWTTTDNAVWIVYRDPDCGGEGEPFVLDNIPGSQTP